MHARPETIWSMWASFFNTLPDISGILLAAVGVALAFLPDKVMKLPPVARWIIATVLVFLGGFGFASSIVQRREDSREKSKLNEDIGGLKGTIGTLQSTIGTLQATVNTYGPKLDFIINQPQSPEQKALALALQREMNPKVEISEPENTADPTKLRWTLINTGGSIAKSKDSLVSAVFGPPDQEEAIFKHFYEHENETGRQKTDMPTGFEHRVLVDVSLPIPTREEQALFASGAYVEYIAILVTYYNEQGRQFHSEKCVFTRSQNPQAAYCRTHNKIE